MEITPRTPNLYWFWLMLFALIQLGIWAVLSFSSNPELDETVALLYTLTLIALVGVQSILLLIIVLNTFVVIMELVDHKVEYSSAELKSLRKEYTSNESTSFK